MESAIVNAFKVFVRFDLLQTPALTWLSCQYRLVWLWALLETHPVTDFQSEIVLVLVQMKINSKISALIIQVNGMMRCRNGRHRHHHLYHHTLIQCCVLSGTRLTDKEARTHNWPQAWQLVTVYLWHHPRSVEFHMVHDSLTSSQHSW